MARVTSKPPALGAKVIRHPGRDAWFHSAACRASIAEAIADMGMEELRVIAFNSARIAIQRGVSRGVGPYLNACEAAHLAFGRILAEAGRA